VPSAGVEHQSVQEGTPVRERLSYLRRRLYTPVPVIVWFLLTFCVLTFLGWPFSFIGFLSLVAIYLWVAWGAPS